MRLGHRDRVVAGTEGDLDELELAVSQGLVGRDHVGIRPGGERASRHAEVTDEHVGDLAREVIGGCACVDLECVADVGAAGDRRVEGLGVVLAGEHHGIGDGRDQTGVVTGSDDWPGDAVERAVADEEPVGVLAAAQRDERCSGCVLDPEDVVALESEHREDLDVVDDGADGALARVRTSGGCVQLADPNGRKPCFRSDDDAVVRLGADNGERVRAGAAVDGERIVHHVGEVVDVAVAVELHAGGDDERPGHELVVAVAAVGGDGGAVGEDRDPVLAVIAVDDEVVGDAVGQVTACDDRRRKGICDARCSTPLGGDVCRVAAPGLV